ncbi:MAG: hypothetical protein AB7Q29_10310 [Vicinamibacterales bacterium]
MRVHTVRIETVLGGLVLLLACAAGSLAQTPADGAALPREATALEGLPQVQVETTQDSVTRTELQPNEAAKRPLAIQIRNGQFFWASRGDRPLTQTAWGEFTYLSSSTEPGQYVRIRRVKDRFTYVEHVDTERGSMTYWGELRIVLGK